MRSIVRLAVASILPILLCVSGCGVSDEAPEPVVPADDYSGRTTYIEVELTADLSGLTDNQRAMLPLLIEASRTMENAFWRQAWGDRDALLASIEDEETRRFAQINYGPWDRLDDNRPFMDGIGDKPRGVQLYPQDMTVEEFEGAVAASADDGAALKSLYTVIRRDAGGLFAVPYSEVYAEELGRAADLLEQAAALAEDDGFREYLKLRATAMRTDDYRASDMAWMDMKDNTVDVVI
ncbi:MAG: Zn-dependent hydrolase, partial [Acidobacteriota bacterium]|nr:Zn-dependent hydrolase [Acidobacteriota bacterium]